MAGKIKNINFGNLLSNTVGTADTVLDIGCGIGAMLKWVKGTITVALDAHRPYLEQMGNRSSDIIPIHADALALEELFLPDTFTVVTMIDVLEHFTKTDALELLRQAESVAKERVVLFTPRGFFPQEAVDHYHLKGEEYQKHRSGWEPEELEKLGYEVFVLEGFHNVRNQAFVEAFGKNHKPVDALLAVKHINIEK